MDIAYNLALVYIQNGDKKISEMSVEEFTETFAETFNRIKVCLSSDENKQMSEQMKAFLKATSDTCDSWAVQT